MTERSSAHLVTAVDDRYFDLAAKHGRRAARLIAEAHSWAIDRIEATVRRENIACDFERVDGYLTLAADGNDASLLERELIATHDAGLLSVHLVEYQPFPALPARRCLRFARQAKIDPLAYARASEECTSLLVSRERA